MSFLVYKRMWNPRMSTENNCSCMLLLILLGFLCFKELKGECDLQYLKEPVSDITCNPYLPSSVLRLQCDLQIPSSTASNRVQILWFFTSNDPSNMIIIDSNSFPPLLQPNVTSVNQNLLTSTISFNGSLLNSSMHSGSYYCRAALNGNFDSFISSNSLTLQNEISYQSIQPCTEIQAMNAARCAGNILLGVSTAASSTAVTRSFGFKLRNVEEDLEVGFYVLILLLVMLVGVGVVVLTVFMGKRCDKNKHLSATHERHDPTQAHSDSVAINMHKINSQSSSKNIKESSVLKLDLGAATDVKKDEPQCKETSMKYLDSPKLFRSDTYVSVAGDGSTMESTFANNAGTSKPVPKPGYSSALTMALPPKPGTECSGAVENDTKRVDIIYEDLMGDGLPSACIRPPADRRETDIKPSSDLPQNLPELPPKNDSASKGYAAVNGSGKERKAPRDLPKIPVKDNQGSDKLGEPQNAPGMLTEALGDASTNDAAVHSAHGREGRQESSQLENALDDNNYDVVPPKADMLPNQAYGVVAGENQDVLQDNENIYEALDDLEVNDELYVDMK